MVEIAVKIFNIAHNSIAENAGLRKNQTIVSINNNEIIDVLDYRFYTLEKKLSIEIIDLDQSKKTINIQKKDEYAELGVEFETYLMDKQHSCRNKCIFCFIDQLPKGLRNSLYFKDDDSRLSFLFGNYITLTNISEHEINRIIKMHISPINISVHTTDKELRCKMLGNRFAGESASIMERFNKANIAMNTQVVLCKGVNDGDYLKQTLEDLSKLYPNVQSISVVPAGLTKHRDGLYALEVFDKKAANEAIDIIEKFSQAFYKQNGVRLAYPSDEFFILAEKPIPNYDYYDCFDQLENGVGGLALLREEVDETLESLNIPSIINKFSRIPLKVELPRIISKPKPQKIDFSIATGVIALPFIKELLDKSKDRIEKLSREFAMKNNDNTTKEISENYNLFAIKNNFFGEKITVAGLVTGGDIIEQLKGKELGKNLIIPATMLKFDEDVFLDDVSVKDVEEALGVNVIVAGSSGKDFVNAVLKAGLSNLVKKR